METRLLWPSKGKPARRSFHLLAPLFGPAATPAPCKRISVSSGQSRSVRRVSRFGRNDPCPCASGRKFKRCCIDRAEEVERREEAAGALYRLAEPFPLLRPTSLALERWATSLEGDLSEDDLAEGRALAAGERERIVALCTGSYRAVWDVLVDGLGGHAHEAEEIVVAGAVATFAAEPRMPHPNDVLHLERCEDCRVTSARALARVIEGCDLWSVLDANALAGACEDAADLREFEAIVRTVAAASWTPQHDQRLALLVGRVRLALPMHGRPLASAALADACARFDAEKAVRAETAALMLESALDAFDAIEAQRAA